MILFLSSLHLLVAWLCRILLNHIAFIYLYVYIHFRNNGANCTNEHFISDMCIFFVCAAVFFNTIIDIVCMILNESMRQLAFVVVRNLKILNNA